jgi:hypothetical protein
MEKNKNNQTGGDKRKFGEVNVFNMNLKEFLDLTEDEETVAFDLASKQTGPLVDKVL